MCSAGFFRLASMGNSPERNPENGHETRQVRADVVAPNLLRIRYTMIKAAGSATPRSPRRHQTAYETVPRPNLGMQAVVYPTVCRESRCGILRGRNQRGGLRRDQE